MPRRRPAIMLYKGDWRKDPELSMCTPATRGIWIDLLCAMDDAEEPGRLTGTIRQLSQLARCTPEEMGDALAELDETRAAHVTVCNGKNVTSNSRVTVECRRMRREAEEREKTRVRVARHRRKKSETSDVTEKVTTPSSVAVAVARTAYEEQQQTLLAPGSAQREEVQGELDGFERNDQPATAKKPRKADPLWEAMMEVCGINGNITKSARGGYNRARKDLADVGATPEEVRRRADIYRRQWPKVSITPTALAKQWAQCERESLPSRSPVQRGTVEARRDTAGEASAEILYGGES